MIRKLLLTMCVLSSCGKSTESAKSVSPDRIVTNYTVRYDAEENSTRIIAEFGFGGRGSVSLSLEGTSSTITADGVPLSPKRCFEEYFRDNSIFGACYAQDFSETKPDSEHVIVYKDDTGREYRNRIRALPQLTINTHTVDPAGAFVAKVDLPTPDMANADFELCAFPPEAKEHPTCHRAFHNTESGEVRSPEARALAADVRSPKPAFVLRAVLREHPTDAPPAGGIVKRVFQSKRIQLEI